MPLKELSYQKILLFHLVSALFLLVTKTFRKITCIGALQVHQNQVSENS